DASEGRGKMAAAEALRKQRARPRLQRIKAGRQPKPQVERLAVDAFQLPNPADAKLVALGPRKPCHAGNTHGRRSPAGQALVIPAVGNANNGRWLYWAGRTSCSSGGR